MTTNDQIKKLILEIIEDNSGGLKFTELLPNLITKLINSNQSNFIEHLTPEFVEELITQTPELKILEYTFKSLNRQKMFIYTP